MKVDDLKLWKANSTRPLSSYCANQFEKQFFLIVNQCELMFAYKLDLSKLRTYATNQNHLLLLLPGKQVSNQILLFHEADQRFQTQFPGQLVTENNLWELKA